MGGVGGEREFVAFLASRGTPLLRSAYLLTGDPDEAEEALIDAAARTRVDWKRIQESGDPEAQVLQHLVTARQSAAGDAAPVEDADVIDHTPADPMSDDAGSDDVKQTELEALDRRRLWQTYLSLPAPQRAVLVLGIHEQLDEEEIARLTRRSGRATRGDIERALAALRSGADPVGHQVARPLAERLTAAFEEREASVRADASLVDRALTRADELSRSRRRRSAVAAGVVVAAIAAVGTAVVLTAPASDPPAAGASPTPTAPSAVTPIPGASGPGASVMAIPDAVLDLARTERALLGYDSAIVDGATDPITVLVKVDPATGASDGGRVVGLARAEGGYVVLTRPRGDSFSDQLLTLAYVPRTGARVELGQVGLATAGFVVAPDGLSVVHVVPGVLADDEDLSAGQTQLEVQTLSGEVTDRLTVDGPAYPLAMDADRVWFSRPIDPVGAPYVWTRATGAVQRLQVRTGLVALEVHGNDVLLHQDRSDGCFVYVNGTDPSQPRELWRSCTGAAVSAIAPSGAQVSLLTGDHPALVLIDDAANGAAISRAVTDTSPVIALAWTADGIRLLAEVHDVANQAVSVISVNPEPTSGFASTTTYRLGSDQVVLGRELPIP